LSLIASPITIQRNSRILVPIILVSERQSRANRNLSTDDAIAAVEALGEHVHGAALAVGDAFAAAEQLADDGLDGAAAHEREAVAAVGGDDVVLLCQGVLDADGDSFLTGREVAEAADLLLFVESVGGHFHTAGGEGVSFSLSRRFMKHFPKGNWYIPN
jgi:hypothetical protein